MHFLYSPNRLNVATSRAKCLAVVVASPVLFTPECRTPEQMRLANAFCQYLEMAVGVGVPGRSRPARAISSADPASSLS